MHMKLEYLFLAFDVYHLGVKQIVRAQIKFCIAIE